VLLIEPTIIETTDSAGANVEKTGPLGHPDEEAQAAR